jgi:biotin carboxyl carrier protein
MKIHAEISGKTHQVEIKREDRKVFATVDDRRYELEVSEPEPGVFLFKHEGRIYEAVVPASAKDGEATHVRIGTEEIDVTLIDPKRLRGAGTGAEHADGLTEIKTAMPGKVVRVLLQPGASVEKGDSVLVVEAMKMQNELKAPKAGTVKEIRVEEGAAVAAGDILATIE